MNPASSNRSRSRRPTIEALRTLSVHAETGVVSETARRLGVTQPVVSRQLQVFKKAGACGAVLIRSNGQVTLTDSGQAVLPAIREVVAGYDRIFAYLRGEQTAPRILRIATGSFAAEHYLPPALSQIQTPADECLVETCICRSRRRILGTANGAFDIGIVSRDESRIRATLRARRLPESVLAITQLARRRLCIVSSRKTATGQQLQDTTPSGPFPVDRLIQWPLIGCPGLSQIRRQLDRLLGCGRLYFAVEAGSWSATIAMARVGLGLAVVPQAMLTADDHKELFCRELPDELGITDFLIHARDNLQPLVERIKTSMLAAANPADRDRPSAGS